MVQSAAHLIDYVLPIVPVRQFVLALPKMVRFYVVRNTELSGKVLKIFLQEVERQFRQNSAPVPDDAKLGSVTFIQRFGSFLNLHLHYHAIVIEGLFYEADDGQVTFAAVNHLGVEDTVAIEERVRQRVLRLLKRRSILSSEQVDSMLQWRHSGGFSVNADVGIDAEDRKGLERLLRYCARPAFANQQISLKDSGLVVFDLSKPTPKGETQLEMSPNDFLDKLAQLIPLPRRHRHRYHGALAGNSPLRRSIVAYAGKPLPNSLAPPESGKQKGEIIEEASMAERQSKPKSQAYWAILLCRLYEVMPLLCPVCHGEMKIIAFIETSSEVKKILDHIGELSEAPQMVSARGPPEAYDFAQTDKTIYLVDPIPIERWTKVFLGDRMV